MKLKIGLSVYFLLFGLLSSLSSQTSSNFLIKGIVNDSVATESIPYATISIVKQESPTVYIKRMATDVNGKFELSVPEKGDYFIVFESVGMQTKYVSVALGDKKTIDLGSVNLGTSSEQLSELTVTASKPLISMDLDKIIYDTASDPEAESNNVLEMLRKVPMVTVDGEDKIQVKGSTSFKIYLDGKPSNMFTNNPSEVLKSMPASSIKNIEVITEPGAKYDAEGVGGIINIVTAKAMIGYTGSVRTSINSLGGYGGGGYFSTKIGKFGLTANLNYNQNKTNDTDAHSEREILDPVAAQKYQYLMSRSKSPKSNMGFSYSNIEASYEIDSLNLLSFSFGGYGGKHKNENESYSEMLDFNKDTVAAYRGENFNESSWAGMDLSLDYQRSFKKPDKLLTFSYRLESTPEKSQAKSLLYNVKKYAEMIELLGADKLLSSVGKSNEHTVQIDYTEPFNKKHIAEAGLKYILRQNNSDNSYKILNTETGDYEDDTVRPVNNFDQTQHILGVYGSYTLKLEKLSIRVGGRFEHTSSGMEYKNDPAKDFSTSFTNLIPSIVFTYRLGMTSNFRLGYNQRISRPGIWYLNPFVDDSNPNYISYGNPDLDAEISNSFNLSYSIFTPKFNMNVNAFTSFTNNSIESVTSLKVVDEGEDNERIVVESTYDNIGYFGHVGGNIYLNWSPTTKIRLYGNGGVNYSRYTNNSDEQKVENSGTRFTFNGGAQFTLPCELKVNIGGGYYSPWIMLEGKGSAYYFTGISLGRDFLDKKLNVSLRVSEPFRARSIRESTTYKENNYSTYNFSSSIARSYSLSVSYRFGEMKEQIKKASRTISNDDLKGGEGQGGSGE
ncbi:MAG: TonB-dependent receptor [Prevotellaceae bacterium]|jgi:outer membrane receptor for ferrienterochelin and colicin|nr:TonB-dependent receptor [Prevotellaceae bacterium]